MNLKGIFRHLISQKSRLLTGGLFMLLICLCNSCTFEFFGNYKAEVDSRIQTEIRFFTSKPSDEAAESSTASFTTSFKIGETYYTNQLPNKDWAEVKALRPGYEVNWKFYRNTLDSSDTNLPAGVKVDDNDNIVSMVTPVDPFMVYADWVVATDTPYTVNHLWQNTDDDDYTLHESEILTGTTGENTAASAKTYEHFTAQTITNVEIKGDGSSVVDIKYDREIITITFVIDETYKNTTGRYGKAFAYDYASDIPSGKVLVDWTVTHADDTKEEHVTDLPEKYEENCTYTAVLKNDSGAAGGNTDIKTYKVTFSLSEADVSAGSSVTITANNDGSEIKCTGWKVEILERDLSSTGVTYTSSTAASTATVTTGSNWEAGTYYVYVYAVPQTADGTKLSAVSDYLTLTVD